jgi:hypothetical protein
LQGFVPDRLRPVFDTLNAALDAVNDGKITPAQGSAMAGIARALVAVLQAGEIEERLRRLEAGASESHT